MNERYFEYRKITDRLFSPGGTLEPGVEQGQGVKRVASDEERRVRDAYIRALTDELEPHGKP